MSATTNVGDQTWRRLAACRGLDPDLFYPERGAAVKVEQARQVCADCPVRAQCAEAGRQEQFGVWGGLSADERLRGKRRARPVQWERAAS